MKQYSAPLFPIAPHPGSTAPDTIVAYAGGIDDAAAKGGFLMPDGTERRWVVSPAVPWRQREQMVDADEGVEITITPDKTGWIKILAHCPGAVEAIR